MNYDAKALAAHKKHQGKISVVPVMPLATREDLSIAYSPGVAAVSRAIAQDKSLARTLTWKGRTVAVVSDGSAILGIGNLGPEAALPVMEGKAALFKSFGGVDAVPIVLSSQVPDDIVRAVELLAPTFGGINLEDISAPRCFEVEERLTKSLSIPVFHDDQHGTAIVILAALTNALALVHKKLPEVKIVINGAGAAAIASAKLLLAAGADPRRMRMVDTHGVIAPGRAGMNPYKEALAKKMRPGKKEVTLADAVADTDIFIGVSVKGALPAALVATMAPRPIVFALANPDPEITQEEAQRAGVAVFGTGRSDLPNQINNVLAFPGLFRGVLDVGASRITEAMKIAAAQAIAGVAKKDGIRADYVVPGPFDARVAKAVAKAVATAWKKGE